MFLSALFSALLMSGSPAHAVDAVSKTSNAVFFISDEVGFGHHVSYGCDGLKDLTQSMLKKLGASDIRVDCSGGYQNGQYWGTPSVSAKFTHAVRGSGAGTVSADYKSVTLRDRENCHAAQQVFSGISDALDLAAVSGTDSFCEPGDSYQIKADALMFN